MKVYFDGASRGNPGEAGAGAVIYDGDTIVAELYKYLGKQTNNYAEYQAILLGIRWLMEKYTGVPQQLEIIGDSQLAIRQLSGQYKVRSANIRPIYEQVAEILSQLSHRGWKISYLHVRRHLNKKADQLANLAIDAH